MPAPADEPPSHRRRESDSFVYSRAAFATACWGPRDVPAATKLAAPPSTAQMSLTQLSQWAVPTQQVTLVSAADGLSLWPGTDASTSARPCRSLGPLQQRGDTSPSDALSYHEPPQSLQLTGHGGAALDVQLPDLSASEPQAPTSSPIQLLIEGGLSDIQGTDGAVTCSLGCSLEHAARPALDYDLRSAAASEAGDGPRFSSTAASVQQGPPAGAAGPSPARAPRIRKAPLTSLR
jgi:hypothetical protein